MALKKTFTFVGQSQVNGDFWTGISEKKEVVAECYIKVVSVTGLKDSASAQVSFASDKANGLKMYSFVPNMEGKNFIAQTYEYLKTLPEFANATDC
jgi:hypothetical protein